jgi:hypothetical protein
VYAYTSSRIQMRVLEEFTRLDCALPNLFVGTLTRDSVQRALEHGVTGDDVIAFLGAHAHPQVAGRMPSVPEVGWGGEGAPREGVGRPTRGQGAPGRPRPGPAVAGGAGGPHPS